VTRLRIAVALPFIGLLLPASVLAAPAPAKMQHAALRVPAALMHNMHYAHAMGSAALTPMGMDWSVKVTTENLPAASTLKARYYDVWVMNGTKRAELGTLKIHGTMGALKATTMMHRVQDVVVTAEKTLTVGKPAGQVVLTGMVG
jgi:hypothetical protein